MCEQPIQIAITGDKSVGKTSIIRQWLFNDYPSTYSSTRLATYHFTSLFNGQRLFHIRIIDTPRFDENNTSDPQQEWVRIYYFRRAHLFLLMVTRQLSPRQLSLPKVELPTIEPPDS